MLAVLLLTAALTAVLFVLLSRSFHPGPHAYRPTPVRRILPRRRRPALPRYPFRTPPRHRRSRFSRPRT